MVIFAINANIITFPSYEPHNQTSENMIRKILFFGRAVGLFFNFRKQRGTTEKKAKSTLALFLDRNICIP